MKKQEILTDHRLLDIDNVKLIKDGDVIVYHFDTMLNGRKREKVIFRENRYGMRGGVYAGNSDEVYCEYLIFDYLDKGQREQWATRDDKEWYNYAIWTNGWNPIVMESINGEKWEDFCHRNGFDDFLSEDQQINNWKKENIEMVKDFPKHSITVGNKDYDFLTVKEWAGLKSRLNCYTESYRFPKATRMIIPGVMEGQKYKLRAESWNNEEVIITESPLISKSAAERLNTIDYYEEDNYNLEHTIIIVGNPQRRFKGIAEAHKKRIAEILEKHSKLWENGIDISWNGAHSVAHSEEEIKGKLSDYGIGWNRHCDSQLQRIVNSPLTNSVELCAPNSGVNRPVLIRK